MEAGRRKLLNKVVTLEEEQEDLRKTIEKMLKNIKLKEEIIVTKRDEF